MIRYLILALWATALAAGCATPPPAPSTTVLPRPQDTPPQAPARVTSLVLMGTTDVHGWLYNHNYYTGQPTTHGLVMLAPVIDSVRAANPGRTLLFDSGDILQGNPLGVVYSQLYATHRNPMIKAMNLLRYDAAAIGNHEFNYGLANLQKAIGEAKFPMVSANTFKAGTNQHAYAPYTIIPVITGTDTLRVGVTGNVPPGVHVWDRDNVQGKLEIREIVSAVRGAVTEMKGKGADIVVVLSHGGFGTTSYDTATTQLPPENAVGEMARQIPGIDVIFMGHTHREVADTTINGVLLTQSLNWGQSLAVATLNLERNAARGWAVTSKRSRTIKPAAEPDRTLLDSLRWEHERTVTFVNGKVGRATSALSARDARTRDVAIIDFINEVQRKVTGAQLSTASAFDINAGIPQGDVTIADVAGLYIYDNTLKAIRITGAQLRAYLEKSAEYYNRWPADTLTNFRIPGYNFDVVSGVDYIIDISRPVGQRITTLTYNGKAVEPNDAFTMAVNNYRQSGGGGYGMIASAPVVYDRGENIRDLLIDEVRRTGSIDPASFARVNWRLIPAEAAQKAAAEQASREIRPRVTPQTSATKKLRVVSTNDFHGNLATITPSWAEGRRIGGAAVLAAYFKLEREGFAGPTILLDGGDVMQGTGPSNLTRGASTVEYFNAAGYDAVAVGNHEFDWSDVVLRERMAQARFPWLAANIVVAGTDTTPSWLRGTAMLEKDGVRIGVIGLMTEALPEVTMAKYIAGLQVLPGNRVLDQRVPELRRAGADFVIVVAHEGVYCEDDATTGCRGGMADWLASARYKPDLVVSGHTHTTVRTRLSGVPVIQSWNWGQRYGVTDLERVSADSVAVWIRGTPASYADLVTPDTAIARRVAAIELELAPVLARLITTSAEEIVRVDSSNLMGRLIADAQRAATGTQIAIMNTGGVRATIPAGRVTWGDLYRVQPFANSLVTMRMSGALLRETVEHVVRERRPRAILSGLVVRYDSTRAPGSRVVSMKLSDGTDVREDVVYTMTTSDFLTAGGDGYITFARATDHVHTGVIDLDALVSYIQAMPQPIRGPRDERLVALPTRTEPDSQEHH